MELKAADFAHLASWADKDLGPDSNRYDFFPSKLGSHDSNHMGSWEGLNNTPCLLWIPVIKGGMSE